MLKGFEEQTHELTDYELNNIVPVLVEGLNKRVGKDRAITNPLMCKHLMGYYKMNKITEPRVRKCIHFIRQRNLVPRLIATSKGYWVATSLQELLDWQTTLKGRINAMTDTYDYATQQIDNWNKPQVDKQKQLF
jgi:hypothetical protein